MIIRKEKLKLKKNKTPRQNRHKTTHILTYTKCALSLKLFNELYVERVDKIFI